MTVAPTKSAASSGDRDPSNHTIVKPTEAQLRYAQFHHKRRAQAVKHRIDRLHQTPLEVTVLRSPRKSTSPSLALRGAPADKNEIDNDNDNDNDTDNQSRASDCSGRTDTSDLELRAVRLRRPKISVGRRALLRHSKRQYRRRKREIAAHGYRGCFLDDYEDDDYEDDYENDDDDDNDYGEGHDANDEEQRNNYERRALDDALDVDHQEYYTDLEPEEKDALNEVFLTRPKPRRHRRKRRQRASERGGGGNRNGSGSGSGSAAADESYQRFQAACHAMMRNIQTSQKPALASVAVPSKRWKRSQAHVDASSALVDFYRYRTSGMKKKSSRSDRSAALLLSYEYYQQNQKDHSMDRGATWLTHLPAKHSKRGSSTFYFHDLDGLPPLHSAEHERADANGHNNGNNNGDDDGSDSCATLSMRQPGPQKFLRLMAYVQQKLIEKEKRQHEKEREEQLLLLDGAQSISISISTHSGGKSRTRAMAESIEAPRSSETAKPSRIRQMADSIEGITPNKGTPTMTLRTGTPFSGALSSAGGSNHRKRKGKSRYVPRMRLRDFALEGSTAEEDRDKHGNNDNGDDDGDEDTYTPLPRRKLSERFQLEYAGAATTEYDAAKESVSPPPTMRLRESLDGPNEQRREDALNSGKTREMALALESGGDTDAPGSGGGNRIRKLRESLEPKQTPRMKLRGSNFVGSEDDEKKTPDRADHLSAVSRTNVDRLSRQFLEQQQQQHRRSPVGSGQPSPTSEIFHEFSSHIDPRIFEQFREEGEGDGRESTGTNVTEFFARLRGEQQQQQERWQQQRERDQQQQQQQQPQQQQPHVRQSSGGPVSSIPPIESKGTMDSDTVSETSRASNLSGLWNRGRTSLGNLTSNLNTIAENQTNKGRALLSPEFVGLGASHVSETVSGLLHKFRGVPEDGNGDGESGTGTGFDDEEHDSLGALQHPNPFRSQHRKQHQRQQKQHPDLSPVKLVHSPSADSHDALRAYRKNRASLSPRDTDAASEASSFHALPDQIRLVVQNSGEKSHRPSNAYAYAQHEQEQEHEPPFTEDKYASPVRSQSTLSPSELSDEQYKRAHGRFLQNSAILGDEFQHKTIIDTDGTQSDASGTGDMDPQTLASLMMSPDILQKRLKQAINSVEQRKWDQVLFLINANPWLAEMKELTTNQFLLHKLAFFGKGPPAAPISLGEQLVQKFPSAVYKFDQDGNVPLHLAAAAGNIEMIQMLGEKFESGASIRNEDGMLPLHFAIASFAEHDDQQYGEDAYAQSLTALKTVLKLFPKAVAIPDNDGNLPLHVASECLHGGIGVDVIFLLLDEAERQLQDPYGARFRNKMKMQEIPDDNMSAATMSTARDTDASGMDSELHCNMVLNDFNETPLFTAIRSQRGWQMIEALVSGPGGRKAALSQDADQNNALHLLVGECQDATAAMSILKIVPETALQRNAAGILPIEIACMQLMPEEVILAIALVDLPVAVDDRDGLKVLKDRGESWTFLTCDSDDHMVRVVEEIVSICSFQQLQELCYMTEHGSENAIIDRATPKCREIMNRGLRFLGRFEFVGDGPLFADIQTGFKAFEALDFGNNEAGKRVLLECYKNEFDFENRCYTMFEVELENNFVEEVNVYVEHLEEDGGGEGVGSPQEARGEEQQQRCVAIERPRMTLDKVVDGVSKNGGYQNAQDLRLKYSAKICSVLRLIAKAIRHLHGSGVVHGNVCLETCGKFEDSMWKLTERLDVQAIGKPFDPTRFRHSFPPETLELLSQEREGALYDSDKPAVAFVEEIVAEPSIDIWGFGKLCYESLVGKPLIEFDTNANDSPSDDVIALLQTAEWNVSNMETVFADLLEAGIGESGADMITSCLFPQPEDRPADMDEILENPFWQEIRKHRSPRKGSRVRRRKGGGSIESTVSLLTDAEKYEI